MCYAILSLSVCQCYWTPVVCNRTTSTCDAASLTRVRGAIQCNTRCSKRKVRYNYAPYLLSLALALTHKPTHPLPVVRLQAQTPSLGNIFFVCGELCTGGELWSFKVHREALKEQFARRIFGQLARGMNVMKHCGDPEPPSRSGSPASRGPSRSSSAASDRTAGGSSDAGSDTDDECEPMPMAPTSMFGGPDDPTARFLATLRERTGAQPLEGSQRVNGCFHRDLKLENLIITGDFDCKIIDYGSLKFTLSHDGGAMPQVTTEHVRQLQHCFGTTSCGFFLSLTLSLSPPPCTTPLYHTPHTPCGRCA